MRLLVQGEWHGECISGKLPRGGLNDISLMTFTNVEKSQ